MKVRQAASLSVVSGCKELRQAGSLSDGSLSVVSGCKELRQAGSLSDGSLSVVSGCKELRQAGSLSDGSLSVVSGCKELRQAGSLSDGSLSDGSLSDGSLSDGSLSDGSLSEGKWSDQETLMPYLYKEVTERHRPHFHPPSATLFVTFRLAGSIPKETLKAYQAQKDWLGAETRRLRKLRLAADPPELAAHEKLLLQFHRSWFKTFEDVLHKAESGPTWLKDERVASLLADALHWRDGRVYRLDAYCIMSNHVHVVFAPHLSEASLRGKRTEDGLVYESEDPPLDVIMHSLKSWTANQANGLLARTGQFWEHESYDHVVRDDTEFARIVKYVLNNPVKARLVQDWREWRWNWKRS